MNKIIKYLTIGLASVLVTNCFLFRKAEVIEHPYEFDLEDGFDYCDEYIIVYKAGYIKGAIAAYKTIDKDTYILDEWAKDSLNLKDILKGCD